MTAPLDFWESCFCGSLTLTHLSLFLFPHCKKNSGSIDIDVDVDVDDNLQALWFFSSFSIPTAKKPKNPEKFQLVYTSSWVSKTDPEEENQGKEQILANSAVSSANPMYFF